MRRLRLTALAVMIATAGPAAALPPIGQNEAIVKQLVEARGADRIRKACEHKVSPRIVTAFSKARALKAEARRMGYSEAEISTFLDSKDERRKIYARAETWLAARGVTKDPETACAAGIAEIRNGSLAGSLLKER